MQKIESKDVHDRVSSSLIGRIRKRLTTKCTRIKKNGTRREPKDKKLTIKPK